MYFKRLSCICLPKTTYNSATSYRKMNIDPEDTWLAIGAAISVALFGICVCLSMYKSCKHRGMKESRSDEDLASMLEKGESA